MILISAMTAAAHWDRNTQGDTEAGLQAATPFRVQALDAGTEPATAPPARKGFQGLRTPVSLERLVSFFMPPLPGGPPITIASRKRDTPAGDAAIMPIRAAVVPVAVVSTEQTAPWYELLA